MWDLPLKMWYSLWAKNTDCVSVILTSSFLRKQWFWLLNFSASVHAWERERERAMSEDFDSTSIFCLRWKFWFCFIHTAKTGYSYFCFFDRIPKFNPTWMKTIQLSYFSFCLLKQKLCLFHIFVLFHFEFQLPHMPHIFFYNWMSNTDTCCLRLTDTYRLFLHYHNASIFFIVRQRI